MRYWIRAAHPIEADEQIAHRVMLAYISDMHLLDACCAPHLAAGNDATMTTSLDNTIWFQSWDFRTDEWFIYEVESPSAGLFLFFLFYVAGGTSLRFWPRVSNRKSVGQRQAYCSARSRYSCSLFK